MNKLLTTIFLASALLTGSSYAAEDSGRYQQSEKAVKTAKIGHIDAKGLKSLMDAHIPLVLLDARGNRWNDNSRIIGAQQAWYTDSANDFQNLIADYESLIVIYCYSFTCPYSPRLADRLIQLGYQNVIEYSGGLTEWRDVAKYPTEKIK